VFILTHFGVNQKENKYLKNYYGQKKLSVAFSCIEQDSPALTVSPCPKNITLIVLLRIYAVLSAVSSVMSGEF
jgi:hypothetical protein